MSLIYHIQVSPPPKKKIYIYISYVNNLSINTIRYVFKLKSESAFGKPDPDFKNPDMTMTPGSGSTNLVITETEPDLNPQGMQVFPKKLCI